MVTFRLQSGYKQVTIWLQKDPHLVEGQAGESWSTQKGGVSCARPVLFFWGNGLV